MNGHKVPLLSTGATWTKSVMALSIEKYSHFCIIHVGVTECSVLILKRCSGKKARVRKHMLKSTEVIISNKQEKMMKILGDKITLSFSIAQGVSVTLTSKQSVRFCRAGKSNYYLQFNNVTVLFLGDFFLCVWLYICLSVLLPVFISRLI